jgi:hypothetical protein
MRIRTLSVLLIRRKKRLCNSHLEASATASSLVLWFIDDRIVFFTPSQKTRFGINLIKSLKTLLSFAQSSKSYPALRGVGAGKTAQRKTAKYFGLTTMMTSDQTRDLVLEFSASLIHPQECQKV